MQALCPRIIWVMALSNPKGTKSSPALEPLPSAYVLSFQAERCHQRMRYYWMICKAQHPDKLISWGYAPTQEQAETAAQDELRDLSSGLTKGGRVALKPFSHRY